MTPTSDLYKLNGEDEVANAIPKHSLKSYDPKSHHLIIDHYRFAL
jgi:hypothetical protein